jgi:hypothetical protein
MGSQAGRNKREEARNDKVNTALKEQADLSKVSREQQKSVLNRLHEADMKRIGTGFKK